MNVRILQQFLENLIAPMEASAASSGAIIGLRHACQGLQRFHDRDVSEFAEFLTRAADYERDGKWPSSNPPIAGRVVDEPTAQEYAQRLRTFLAREVQEREAISEQVRAELVRLSKRLKPQQVKEIARELQVEEGFRGAKQGIEKIVFRLTGQSLSGKQTAARPRGRGAKTDEAAIQQYALELRNLTGSNGLEQRLAEMVQALSVPNLRALAEILGATANARTKAKLNEIIRSALESSSRGEATPSGGAMGERPEQESKVLRLAEIIAALKGKADGPDAPYDEIEAELRSLEDQMDRDEAIAIARQVGAVRHLTSRNEAIEEIRRKVFEMKRARESIAY